MMQPDFLVVGTARAGTSALHYYLRQHPGLFLPSLKEPCYYCFAGEKLNYKHGKFAFAVRTGAEYSRLFKNASPGMKKGEISTPYLYLYDQTIKNIKSLHSDPEALKIIIILRNPVDRAYSQYLWKVRDGREELSFDEALHQEKKRMLQNYSFDYFYAHRGLYYRQVKAYLDNFPNVKIFTYEEFSTDIANTLSELCSFLKVDPGFVFSKRDKINSSRMPRFSALGKIITMESRTKYKLLNILPDSVRIGIKEQFIRWNSTSTPLSPISEESRRFLNDYYKADLQNLQSLTGLNLSSWING
jgi:hypothetical protein